MNCLLLRLIPELGKFVLAVLDLNGAGAQRCRQEQGAERSYAWSPGLQRPSSHTAIYGAHPQGTSLGSVINVAIIVKKNNTIIIR